MQSSDVIQQLRSRLGEPTNDNSAVSHWQLAPWLDVTVKKQSAESFSSVWMSWGDGDQSVPSSGEFYAADRGRDFHSYRFGRTLAQGCAALLLRLGSQADLEQAIQLILSRK